MNRSLVFTLALAGVLSGGFLVLDDLGAGSSPADVLEEKVNANLLRVRINGEWEEMPLMPLADHLCQSGNELFEKYCDDDVVSPGDAL